MIHAVDKLDYELLTKYYEATNKENSWEPRYNYRLYGVVCHSGSMRGGHYVAYTSYDYKGKRHWLFMSDSYVEQVDEAKVLSCEAYILFYEKIATTVV